MRNGESDQVSVASDFYDDEYAVWAYRTDEDDAENDPKLEVGTPVVALYISRNDTIMGNLIVSPSDARALAADLYTAAANAETETL